MLNLVDVCITIEPKLKQDEKLDMKRPQTSADFVSYLNKRYYGLIVATYYYI